MATEIFVIFLTTALAALFGTAPITLMTFSLFFAAVALSVAVMMTLNKSSWKTRGQRIFVTFIYSYAWGGVVGIFIANESALAFQITALAMTCAGIVLFYKKMKS
jgi:uncharacterized membrane protein